MSNPDQNLDSVFDDSWGEDHRSGVVAVVGRPNVGKSTLINQLLGEKIAIVSPKPQTTRKRQLGIYTRPDVQILFIDTPGLHAPQHKLGEVMVRDAESAFRDADVILMLIDVSEPPEAGDRRLAETVEKLRRDKPVFLVLNKADLLNESNRDLNVHDNSALIKHDRMFVISAIDGSGVPELVEALKEKMPLGPRYYPADQLSEVNLRFVASETIREKVMLNTEQEIPHAVAVEVDSYQEREAGTHYISAVIYVERDSQKGIIIGKGGEMIKRIGSEARVELERINGVKVFLELRVKVLKNWREDEKLMQRLGYRPAKDEDK
jgi:GTP-binding protein Era